jgi:hypothetical protein
LGGSVYDNGAIDAPTLDPGQIRPNEITDSFNGAAGVAHVQQNEGSANSINAAAAVQAWINQPVPAGAGAFVGSSVHENYAMQTGGTRTNDVTNSFVDSQGVFTVQQNNGDQNEIGSAEAVAYGANSVGDAGAFVTMLSETHNNFTEQTAGTRENEVINSFREGSAGVFTVQQNNGDHNAIGAGTAVYGASGGYGDVNEAILIQGSSVGNYGYDGEGGTTASPYLYSTNANGDSVRDNTIDPSFDGASGIATVQQNNGNANAISAATAVTGDVGGQEVPGSQDDDVGQEVIVNGFVAGGYVVDWVVDPFAALSRDNTIEGGSFNSFQGIATVQQNNGDHNVLGAGTAVNYNYGLTQAQMQNDAEQGALVDNVVVENMAYDVDTGDWFGYITPKGLRNNTIDESFDAAAGIASVQQNNGNLNSMGIANAVQANVNTTANGVDNLDGNDDVRGQMSDSLGEVVGNQSYHQGGAIITDTIEPAHRDNAITNSFGGFQGLATVQQNNGDNNAIGASNVVAVVIDSTDKIDGVGDEYGSSAYTGGFVAGNLATESEHVNPLSSGSNRLNTINPSFNEAQGIVTVQQNNGNNNAINSATAVAGNLGPVGDNGDLAAGSVNNYADGEGQVTGNQSYGHEYADRKNTIMESFQGAAGIMTVQQNNGDNNVMGASTAVAADVDTGGTGFGPAMSVASLQSSVSGNTTVVYAPAETPGLLNTINTGAFDGAAGVMTVQQNNGNNNVMQSAIAVSANYTTPQ